MCCRNENTKKENKMLNHLEPLLYSVFEHCVAFLLLLNKCLVPFFCYIKKLRTLAVLWPLAHFQVSILHTGAQRMTGISSVRVIMARVYYATETMKKCYGEPWWQNLNEVNDSVASLLLLWVRRIPNSENISQLTENAVLQCCAIHGVEKSILLQ